MESMQPGFHVSIESRERLKAEKENRVSMVPMYVVSESVNKKKVGLSFGRGELLAA